MNRSNQARSLFARCTASRTLQALVAVAALGTLTPLQAEPPAAPAGATAEQNDQMQAARQLHGEYVELQNRLGMIQEKAVQAHPELQKQEQALQELMMAKMNSGSGKSTKDEMAAINQLEQKLRSEDTPESERQALMGEYQEKVKAFRTAQAQALKDPEVQKAQSALMDATLAAMKQQDPQTEQLMQQLQQKQEQMKQMMESAGHAQ
jgi:hypothetical protein